MQYKVNAETGEWRHHNHTVFKERRWLGHISYTGSVEIFFLAWLNACLFTWSLATAAGECFRTRRPRR